MASIVASTEISRSPDDVFAYVTDPNRLPEWQESVVRAESSQTPAQVGTRARVTRRIGRRDMTQSAELAELTPPTSWKVRGVDGPVRGNVNGRIEPLDDGARSRVTIELDLQGHGIGRLLLPLVVRRKAEQEMPRNMQLLKQRLEGTQAYER
jgi:uncharacterized protein YndB with AHSA1/START domain